MRKGMGVAAALVAMLVLGPGSAGAAVTLGSTQSANTACAVPNLVDVQTAVTPGVNSYTVPAGGGVITSWQHQARQIAGAQLKFKVLRPLGPLAGPAGFQFVGESIFQAVPEPVFYDFPVRIPVNAGDRIGLATASNAGTSPPACNTGTETNADEVYEGADFTGSATLNPFNTFRLNVSAKLEPDADKDGYGDETQDKCATDATTQGVCPTPAKRCPAKKKKKKKKKKGRSASAAKKKKGKKKKKKC